MLLLVGLGAGAASAQGLPLPPSVAVYDAQGRPVGVVREVRPGTTWELRDRYARLVGVARQGLTGVEVFDRYGRRVGQVRPGGSARR